MKTKPRLITRTNPATITKRIRQLEKLLEDRRVELCQADEILKEIRTDRAREQERHLAVVDKLAARRNARETMLTAQCNEELADVVIRLRDLQHSLNQARQQSAGAPWVREIITKLRCGTNWSGDWRCLWLDDQAGWCVLRKSGGKCWSGRGSTVYAPIITALFSREVVNANDQEARKGGIATLKLATRQHRGRMSDAMLESWVMSAL